MIGRCEDCAFWERWVSPTHKGLCRRYAPRPRLADCDVSNHNDSEAWWPNTIEEEWCGEFQKR